MPQWAKVFSILIILLLANMPARASDWGKWAIAFVPDSSDRNLDTARGICAIGRMQAVMNKQRKRGDSPPPVSDYCEATLRETMRRGHNVRLYVAMQPDRSGAEWKAIFEAAGQGATNYVNATGESKILPCELAFDAGYVFGHEHPEQNIRPDISDVKIQQITKQCFDAGSKETKMALIAGARLAQDTAIGLEQ